MILYLTYNTTNCYHFNVFFFGVMVHFFALISLFQLDNHFVFIKFRITDHAPLTNYKNFLYYRQGAKYLLDNNV